MPMRPTPFRDRGVPQVAVATWGTLRSRKRALEHGYELYEAGRDATENNYVDVRIPDLQPAGGPFVPAAADQVTFTVHGSLALPWPVLHRFISAVEATGDIVGEGRLIT